VRLLTLTGPAGVGKTRLAIEVGDRLFAYFSQDLVFVDLSWVRDPSRVLRELARGVGLQDVESPRLSERLFAYLRERRFLVILDNFEQVLPAAGWLADLLAACPGTALLVTSREPLSLRWEQTYRVPPLPLPDPDHLPTLLELEQVPAMALFLERARAIDPGFALDAENARAVAELCVRLDGLPLAIELAAARTGILSPQMILGRLDHRLSLLRWAARDLPERQQTLRSAIGWSYALLETREQSLLRRLGVFAGSFTMDAARALTPADGEEAVLDELASLVDKSLVQVDYVNAEEVRYRLLESVREYALERLRLEDELEEPHRAHALYFLALAERAEPELIGRNQARWFHLLEQDHGNLSTALRWLSSRDENALALRLVVALGHLWVRGHMAEGRRFLEDLVRREPVEALEPRALGLLGTLLLYQGEEGRARAVLEDALAAARSANDPRGVALSLIGLGMHANLGGGFGEGLPWLEEALVCSREAGDAWVTARALHELGVTALHERDHARAKGLLEEARAGYASIGDERTMAEALLLLGMVTRERGDVPGAVDLVRQALGISRRLRDRRLLNMCMNPTIWLVGDAAEPRQLARLIGVNEALHQITGFARSVWKRSLFAPMVATLGARLDEEEIAAARRGAYAMSLEQMAQLALEALDERAGSRRAGPEVANHRGILSPRELEVLGLVAEGLSDREIAEELFITERTVRYHLTSVFGKLGADNRTRAVTLAGRQNLL
jgi:non-specific serine/threonine protein kinase